MRLVELSDRAWLSMLSPAFLQQAVTFNLTGASILLIILVVGGYIGWVRGLRAILTVSFMSILGYILTVRGGGIVIEIINRFYSNLPRFAAFLIGRDPDTVPPLDPLISPDFQAPLFFRFVMFVVFVVIGFAFNTKSQWYSQKKERLSPLLGMFTGSLTALIWIDGLATFAREAGGIGGFIGNLLAAIPDFSFFIPALLTVFFIALFVIILFNLPKVWKA